MFTYADGSVIKVGDTVLHERGNTSGTVELVVATQEEAQALGVAERGVMLMSAPFGRVYLPEWSLRDDPLHFVGRAPAV